MGSALLHELDQEAIHHGALRMLALVEPGKSGEVPFAHQGFDRIDGLHFYVRSASMVPEELAIVQRYGGHFPWRGLWKEIKGFSTTKELLERRNRRSAGTLRVGGECRATSARGGDALRATGDGQDLIRPGHCVSAFLGVRRVAPFTPRPWHPGAAALRAALEDLSHVDRLVCFLDEADEIASTRASRPESQPIVNELLKAIPVFKSRPGRLMVMATNSIASIDPAMLRPGRFDLIIPIGAPDQRWPCRVGGRVSEKCDAEEIAEHTEGFTPADFALAAQRAAQLAFERALEGGAPAVTSEDCADAVPDPPQRPQGGGRGLRRRKRPRSPGSEVTSNSASSGSRGEVRKRTKRGPVDLDQNQLAHGRPGRVATAIQVARRGAFTPGDSSAFCRQLTLGLRSPRRQVETPDRPPATPELKRVVDGRAPD